MSDTTSETPREWEMEDAHESAAEIKKELDETIQKNAELEHNLSMRGVTMLPHMAILVRLSILAEALFEKEEIILIELRAQRRWGEMLEQADVDSKKHFLLAGVQEQAQKLQIVQP